MGTEFSRRVNAWIAVSGAAWLATCANCSMWKIAEERGTGTEKGREDAEEEREVGSQSRKIAIKIRTTRHKKHGNGM